MNTKCPACGNGEVRLNQHVPTSEVKRLMRHPRDIAAWVASPCQRCGWPMSIKKGRK